MGVQARRIVLTNRFVVKGNEIFQNRLVPVEIPHQVYKKSVNFKTNSCRIIGLTKDSLLIFNEKSLNTLMLDDWIRIHNIS